jgi:hypothetical protein
MAAKAESAITTALAIDATAVVASQFTYLGSQIDCSIPKFSALKADAPFAAEKTTPF